MPSCDFSPPAEFLKRVQSLERVQRRPYDSKSYEAVYECEINESKAGLLPANECLELRSRTGGQEQRESYEHKKRQQDVPERMVFIAAREVAVQDAGEGACQPATRARQSSEIAEETDLDPRTLRRQRGREKHERQSSQGRGTVEKKAVQVLGGVRSGREENIMQAGQADPCPPEQRKR